VKTIDAEEILGKWQIASFYQSAPGLQVTWSKREGYEVLKSKKVAHYKRLQFSSSDRGSAVEMSRFDVNDDQMDERDRFPINEGKVKVRLQSLMKCGYLDVNSKLKHHSGILICQNTAGTARVAYYCLEPFDQGPKSQAKNNNNDLCLSLKSL
jgi:hypothetical protein